MRITHQTPPMLGYHEAKELFIESAGQPFGHRPDAIERELG